MLHAGAGMNQRFNRVQIAVRHSCLRGGRSHKLRLSHKSPDVGIWWRRRAADGVVSVMDTSSSGVVVFKPYQPNQPTFLPPSLDELLAPHHLVRVVSAAIDRMDITPLVAAYPGGGASSYHPKMLLKVLVYAYTQRLYSSRQIAKAVREQIPFMWLAGGNRPDFRTIARFRCSRLKQTIDEVFAALVDLLIEEGLLGEEAIFVDGTKLEADANKYSYIWRKSTARYKRQRQEKIAALLDEIERVNTEEQHRYGDRDLEEVGEASTMTAEKLRARIDELNERLAQQDADAPSDETGEEQRRRTKKAVGRLEKEHLPKLEHYEEQERMLGDRNSCSKTDPDATFMRLKEDPMQGGQLKAAYNVQLSTQHQFVVGYSVHQSAGDSGHLIPHLEKLRAQRGKLPLRVVADGAYGSEENYAYLDKVGVDAFLLYNTFYKEQTRAWKEDPYRIEHWPYDEATDSYRCPEGRTLSYQHTEAYTSDNGYRTSRRIYLVEDCSGCPVREACLPKGATRRRTAIGEALNVFRAAARERLHSPLGEALRRQRSLDVEPVFGQIKRNRGFRRFMLRGLEKVNVELGLLALAQNLIKWWQRIGRTFQRPVVA